MDGVQKNRDGRGTVVGKPPLTKQEGDGRHGCKVPGRLAIAPVYTLLVPQTAAAASNVVWVCFGFLFSATVLSKHVLFVLVGSEPVLGGDFCSDMLVCFVFVLCFESRFSSGGARPSCVLCIQLASLGVFCLPLLVFPLPCGSYYFPWYLSLLYKTA